MNPQTKPADRFESKWRIFHPMTRVWLTNPFDHDVVFQVADEHDRPFKYRLPSHKVSELPGGAIATLGVKAIVDELIQNTKGDEMGMWDQNIRRKHEDAIIMRVKETTPVGNLTSGGEVDLGVKSNDVQDIPEQQQKVEETAFPGLNELLTPLPAALKSGMGDIMSASLPRNDSVINAGE